MLTVPVLLPSTAPDDDTEAMVTSEELHDPPLVASVSVITAPGQTESRPVIALTVGVVITVTGKMAESLPHALETL